MDNKVIQTFDYYVPSSALYEFYRTKYAGDYTIKIVANEQFYTRVELIFGSEQEKLLWTLKYGT